MIIIEPEMLRQNEDGYFEEYVSAIEIRDKYIIIHFATVQNTAWQSIYRNDKWIADIDESNQAYYSQDITFKDITFVDSLLANVDDIEYKDQV
jgi:hypothetical protein